MPKLGSSRRWFLLLLGLTFLISIVRSQFNPLDLGEFGIQANTASNVWIYVTNSGQVFGSRCMWYPPTSAYNSRDNGGLTKNLYLQEVDRNGCNGTGSEYFAFGLYTVGIEGHTMQVDFRDADYEDGNGFGTNYAGSDVQFYYNHNDGKFYYDANHTQVISYVVGIWQGGRKSTGPRFPYIIKSNSGQVAINGTPTGVAVDSVKWSTDSYTISSYNPGTREFGQGYVVNSDVSLWGTTYSFPAQPSGLAASRNPSDGHILLTWNANSDPVSYYDVWSNLHDGGDDNEWLSVATTSTTSFVDPQWIYNSSGDFQVGYKIRAVNSQSLYSTFSPVTTVGAEWFHKVAVIPVTHEFRLQQNFPNPFNPSTVIRYELAKPEFVTLTVVNTLGQRVTTLVSESQGAGLHEVKFTGTGLASGMYLYRIVAGSFVQMKTLMLLR